MSVIKVAYSHLFPGLALTVPPNGEVTIAFADGSRAEAAVVDFPGGELLRVAAYTTTAGTEIPEKLWMVRRSEAAEQITLVRAM